jgi:hypothetical protein
MANQMSHSSPVAVEEHIHGETVWVAVRARGADWSWLTREEAARIGRQWAEQYGAGAEPVADKPERPASPRTAPRRAALRVA